MKPPSKKQRLAYLNAEIKKLKRKPKKGAAGVRQAIEDQEEFNKNTNTNS